MCLWPQNKFRSQWPIFHGPVIFLLLFLALKNILVSLAKLNSGELCCPATAHILLIEKFQWNQLYTCIACIENENKKNVLCWPNQNQIHVGYLAQSVLIWAMPWENLFVPYANNKGTDQPAHLHSLISAFVIHCLDSLISFAVLWLLSCFYSWAERFESYLVKNPEDRFSHDLAHLAI